jgi:hypothetical protein
MAHKASCHTGKPTGGHHPRSRLYACLQISRVALDDTLGVELLVKIQREWKKKISYNDVEIKRKEQFNGRAA